MNAIAALLLRPPPGIAPDMMAHIIWPGSADAISIQRAIFPGESDEQIRARMTAPLFAMHPTLPMMTEKVVGDIYRVGVEGLRYEPGGSDGDAKDSLRGNRPKVFLFGGSTMFGHGSKGDETISHFLAPLLPAFHVLNFGAQGYTQGTEIKKLIYLLQLGYRPQSVVFLDGWNDLMHLARSNMRSVDHFLINSHAIKRGEIAFTPGASFHRPNYWRLLAESLPLYRLFADMAAPARSAEDIMFNRDAFIDGFDFLEADLAYRVWGKFSEIHGQALTGKVLGYYSENLMLLKALGAAYGFEVLVLFQPVGLMDPSNAFVREAARTAPGFNYVAGTVRVVRSEIASGRLAMVDATSALDDVNGHRYLDVAHYSPAANRALARLIALKLKRN
ncbi:MAG: hypothetical protein ACKVSF_15775 [Alphaproteobacteria bacterium]